MADELDPVALKTVKGLLAAKVKKQEQEIAHLEAQRDVRLLGTELPRGERSAGTGHGDQDTKGKT